jgi:hypothetical protein
VVEKQIISLVQKGDEYEIYGAKARNIKDINCHDLKVVAIKYQPFTGL